MERPHHIVTNIITAKPKRRATSSEGAKVMLSDGREYIDLMNGKGSVTLGHHHPAVNSAISQHLLNRVSSATCWSDYHEDLAGRIIGDVGMKDSSLALFSSGTEACRAAVLAARHFSGRQLIASAGYHGWGEYWGSSGCVFEANTSGVLDFYFIPELLEEILARYRGQVALVIVSPDYIHLQTDTLRKLLLITKREGILFCCDDVKQGYRTKRGSNFPVIPGYYPDLFTFAKGLANGHRLSCLVGRADVLELAREFTYTAYFDTIPIVAALATLDYMDRHNGYQKLVQTGNALAEEMRKVIKHRDLPILVCGDGPFLQFVCASEALEDVLHDGLAMAGLLLYEGDSQAISLATADVFDELIERFECGVAITSSNLRIDRQISITRKRRFQAAFRMIDGASDFVPAEDAIRWIQEGI